MTHEEYAEIHELKRQVKELTEGFWAIEFRSGSFLISLEAENGGPIRDAMRFPTKKACVAFMDANQWVYMNGGMAVHAGLHKTHYLLEPRE